MSNEYATTDQLTKQIGAGSAPDPTLLDIVNESVSRAIDDYCGRRFYADDEAVARVFCAVDPCVLDVPDFFDLESLVVETDDNADGTFETTWAESDYQLEPLNADALGRPWRQLVAVDVRRWPVGGPRARARVTTKWGWAAIPSQVVEAHLIQCNRIFKRKDSAFGVAGGVDLGELRMLASRLDPDVQVMLAGLRPGGALAGPGTLVVR